MSDAADASTDVPPSGAAATQGEAAAASPAHAGRKTLLLKRPNDDGGTAPAAAPGPNGAAGEPALSSGHELSEAAAPGPPQGPGSGGGSTPPETSSAPSSIEMAALAAPDAETTPGGSEPGSPQKLGGADSASPASSRNASGKWEGGPLRHVPESAAASPTNPRTSMSSNGDGPLALEKLPEDMEPLERMKHHALEALNGRPVTIVMTTFTVYALFGDDTRALGFPKGADQTFLVLSSIAFALFIIECLTSCWCKPGYFTLPNFKDKNLHKYPECLKMLEIGSFFFWLDLVGTLSLIFELSYWYPDAIAPTELANVKAEYSELASASADAAGGGGAGDADFSSARAGRASRAGARAGRIVRIVRMVRLVRLVKLYKYASEAKKNLDDEHENAPDEDDEEEREESHVGAAMSALTTRRVIMGVLAMLVALPLLTYNPDDARFPFAANYVNRINVECAVRRAADMPDGVYACDADSPLYETFTVAIGHFVKSLEGCPDGKSACKKVIDLTVDTGAAEPTTWRSETYPDLREAEKLILTDVYRKATVVVPEGSAVPDDAPFYDFSVLATFDQSEYKREVAKLGILLTIFVIILLGAGTMVFSQDVNRLVIIPIERMVSLVRDISENPLGYTVKEHKTEAKEGMETTLLIQTITKLGGLMRVGFGQAGADVIAKNLNESGGGGGKLNLLGGGSMIKSIFGFCDIRRFTDTTECLQEEVMLFVNRIANVLHTIVTQCGGAANKNIGDAFLLTWKLLPEFSENEISVLADRSLLAFLKFSAEMCRHNDAICKFSVAATSRLYQRIPGYRVAMGLGLHVGWAVEGAIGSEKKIDASYISPHVNMSEYLESSTKKYGVPLLMSEPFYDMLSSVVKGYCRQVDNIRPAKAQLKNEPPMGLFTYDCDMTAPYDKRRTQQTGAGPDSLAAQVAKRAEQRRLESERLHAKKTKRSLKSVREERKRKLAKKARRKSADNSGMAKDEIQVMPLPPYTLNIWDNDADLRMLRRKVEGPFIKQWRDGMRCFLDGQWDQAATKFANTLSLSAGNDGPSKHLMEYIESMGGKPPEGWKGFRDGV